MFRVHRLVLMAFKGKSDLHVHHINSIPTDNRLENLKYCTLLENNTIYSRRKSSAGIRNIEFNKSKGWYRLRMEIEINTYNGPTRSTVIDVVKDYYFLKKMLGEKYRHHFRNEQIEAIKTSSGKKTQYRHRPHHHRNESKN